MIETRGSTQTTYPLAIDIDANFKPCVIIPVYNHSKFLATICQRLNQLRLPCLLVNDGSDPQFSAAIKQVAAQFDHVDLIDNTINRGKGAAVCQGLRWAYQRDFTHALQIDADGQHDLDDIPQFIAAARAHPNAVISGERRYDSVPKSRRYGRWLTDIWVWINTLSFAIKDSMCGYRLYPLAATNTLLGRATIGARMDFDSDIIVRLYWQGLSIHHVPTKVLYAREIPSHFDVVRDNMRISRMHARLFFGMLWRLPTLLRRNLFGNKFKQ